MNVPDLPLWISRIACVVASVVAAYHWGYVRGWTARKHLEENEQ